MFINKVSHKVDELCEEVHEAHEAAEVLGFVDPPGSKARIRNLIEIIGVVNYFRLSICRYSGGSSRFSPTSFLGTSTHVLQPT